MRDQVTRALPVADRDIERVLTGEAPPELAARVEALAREHPALAAHLAERRAEQAAFKLMHPRPPAPARTPARSGEGWLAALARSGGLAGAAAAACVALFFVAQPAFEPAEGAVRDKGARPVRERVLVVAKRGERVFQVQRGALLRPGDALRVEVACGAPSHVVVGLVEGDTRAVSMLVDGEVVPAQRTALAGSFVLDDHLGDETLVVACAPSATLAKLASTDIQMGRMPRGATLVPLRKGP